MGGAREPRSEVSIECLIACLIDKESEWVRVSEVSIECLIACLIDEESEWVRVSESNGNSSVVRHWAEPAPSPCPKRGPPYTLSPDAINLRRFIPHGIAQPSASFCCAACVPKSLN